MSPAPLSPAPLSPAPLSPALRLRRLLPAAAALALSVAVVGASTTVALADPGAAAVTPAGRYFAITPTRILDTRSSGGAIVNGGSRVIDFSRAFSGDAAAVVVNLTVTNPTWGGYLTAYPAGTPKPLASSLNFDKGQTRANSVTVAVGQGDKQNQLVVAAAVANSGSAQVIVDVLGWYGKGGGAQGSSYLPLPAPVRLFDTRSSIGGLTTTYPKNIGIVTLDYGSPTINRTITAAVMNITVTGSKGAGNLTLWDGSGPPPLVSTLNFTTGQTVANLAVVPVTCTDSTCKTVTFSIKNNLSPYTQVIGDISGVYTTPAAAGLVYQPLAPTRITDTRERMPFSKLGAKAMGTTDVTSLITSDTRALNINLTGVKPMTSTYLTVFPTAATAPPVSNLNMAAGTVAANAAQVKIAAGKFSTSNFAGWTDVVIDLQGTFVSDPALKASAKAALGTTVAGSIS